MQKRMDWEDRFINMYTCGPKYGNCYICGRRVRGSQSVFWHQNIYVHRKCACARSDINMWISNHTLGLVEWLAKWLVKYRDFRGVSGLTEKMMRHRGFL